jgi:hypothetical protein
MKQWPDQTGRFPDLKEGRFSTTFFYRPLASGTSGGKPDTVSATSISVPGYRTLSHRLYEYAKQIQPQLKQATIRICVI